MFRMGKRTRDYLFHDTVKPVVGSIVHCRLFSVLAEHTGIYIGSNQVVELKGNGEIKMISLREFTHSTLNRAGIVIYVACDNNEKPLGSQSIAQRAREMVGKRRSYSFLLDNCHQFTSGAITGDFENTDNFFWMVEETIKEYFSINKIKWRAIELNTY